MPGPKGHRGDVVEPPPPPSRTALATELDARRAAYERATGTLMPSLSQAPPRASVHYSSAGAAHRTDQGQATNAEILAARYALEHPNAPKPKPHPAPKPAAPKQPAKKPATPPAALAPEPTATDLNDNAMNDFLDQLTGYSKDLSAVYANIVGAQKKPAADPVKTMAPASKTGTYALIGGGVLALVLVLFLVFKK